MQLRAILAVLACLCACASLRAAETNNPAEPPWIIESPGRVTFQQGTVFYSNEVKITYGDAILTAQRASLNQTTGDCAAGGNVRLESGSRVWTGDKLRYNFKTRQIVGEDFKVGQPPYFAQGSVAVGELAHGVYVLTDGLVTTDDNVDPNHRIRARVITVVPGEYIECEDAVVYLGDVPVFWWPKLRRSLKPDRDHWSVTPGYRNKYGLYLLTTYDWKWTDRLGMAIHLDERTARGPGVGPDFHYRVPHFGEGLAKYYYTYDNRPGEDERGRNIDHHRQRAWFEHQGTLASNLTLKAAVRYQTDSQIIRDFFLSEFHDNAQPATYVELAHSWHNWTLDALVQPRVNRFQETVERLPDVRLAGLRQRLGPTPLYYESESSAAYLQREFAYDATNRFAAPRADTFHQILLPWTFFNWLNVTPRAGGRFTYYGDSTGSGSTTQEESRWVFNTGAEASTKLSRTWPGARSRFFDIDGVRHILQPSLNYAYVPNPSEPLEELPQFDYELPTTRLLPFTYPEYNRIDSIDSQNVLRFGLRNKLQTKRRGQIENFLHWNTYLDWRLDPNDRQRTWSDAYSDLDLRPFHWLTFNSQLAYDINDTRWDAADHSATIAPNDIWSVRVGHRFLRDGAYFGGTTEGHNIVHGTVYYRFDPNWAVRLSHYYNTDLGLLQRQQYGLYRDFRSFTVAVTASLHRSLGEPLDYGVALTFSFKARPRYSLGSDVNKQYLLLGY